MSTVSSIVRASVSDIVRSVVLGESAAEPDSLLTDLVAWWSLDEASGTRVNAHNPGTHDLTDNNTVGQTTGVVGNAAAFVVANDESLSCAYHADLIPGDTDFEVCGWAKFASTSDNTAAIICSTTADTSLNTNGSWAVTRSGTNAQIHARVRKADDSGVIATAGINITYDTFFFYDFWYDSATQTIYLEVNRSGAPQSASVGQHCLSTGDALMPLRIGGLVATRTIEGAADIIRIWKGRLLTTDEKNRIYNSGADMGYPG